MGGDLLPIGSEQRCAKGVNVICQNVPVLKVSLLNHSVELFFRTSCQNIFIFV